MESPNPLKVLRAFSPWSAGRWPSLDDLAQDIEATEDGRVRIARRVAKNRVISTVDPEARHGHKTWARGFDGYKGHISIDPDIEIVTRRR